MQRAVYSLPRTARSSLDASIERIEVGPASQMIAVAVVDLGPVLEMAVLAVATGVAAVVAFAIGLRLYIGAVERRDRRGADRSERPG